MDTWVLVAVAVAVAVVLSVVVIRIRASRSAGTGGDAVCGRPNCVKCTFRRLAPQLPSDLERVLTVHPNLAAEGASQRISKLVREIAAGQGPVAHVEYQNPTGFLMPDLAARRFWDDEVMVRRYWPWIDKLHASAELIRNEFLAAYDQIKSGGVEAFVVYESVAKPRAATWSALEFYNQGLRNDENCAFCPRTVELLESIPDFMKDVGLGFAYFSILEPGMKTQPMNGLCNARLRVQLPLVVPSGSVMVVGNQRRAFEYDRVLIFDDSFLHSVEHNGAPSGGPVDDCQVVLLFDVWHPGLTPAERKLFTHLFPSNPEAY